MLRSASLRFAALTLTAGILVSAVACGTAESAEPAETATPETLESFYIEARVDAHSSSEPESSALFPAEEKTVSTMRWWYEAPDRFRREAEVIEPGFNSGSSLIVTAGDEWVAYDGNMNTYQATPAPEFTEGTVPAPLSGFLLGPIPGGSMDAWVEGIRRGSPQFSVILTGTEEMLGREVSVYEFSSIGNTVDEDGTATGSGSSRVWIDESLGIVLKYEMAGGEGQSSVMAEVTSLEVNVDVPDERFEFELPDGAREVEQTEGSITVQGGSSGGDFPERFLQVGFVPEGMYSVSGSSSKTFGGYERSEVTWGMPGQTGGPAFRVRQKVRVSGLPEAYMSEEVIARTDAPHGGSYYVHRSDDGRIITLAWQDGDITVALEGVGMELEQLLEIAVSTMRPGTEVVPEG